MNLLKYPLLARNNKNATLNVHPTHPFNGKMSTYPKSVIDIRTITNQWIICDNDLSSGCCATVESNFCHRLNFNIKFVIGYSYRAIKIRNLIFMEILEED